MTTKLTCSSCKEPIVTGESYGQVRTPTGAKPVHHDCMAGKRKTLRLCKVDGDLEVVMRGSGMTEAQRKKMGDIAEKLFPYEREFDPRAVSSRIAFGAGYMEAFDEFASHSSEGSE